MTENIAVLRRTVVGWVASFPATWYGAITRVAFILLMFGAMTYLRNAQILTAEKNAAGYALVSLGFILLAAHNFSIVMGAFGLPHVTSYILIGLLSGPFCLNLMSAPIVKELGLVNSLALGLIAFIAGGELRLRTLGERWKSLLCISFAETILVFTGATLVFWLLAPSLPFVETINQPHAALAVALVMGGYIIVNSPAVTIGILNEYQPRGPVSQTTLGVVVIKDIIVVLVFGVALALAKPLVDPTEKLDLLSVASHFGRDTGGAVLFGICIGLVVALYLKFIKTDLILFTVGMALFCYQAARENHFDAILLCLVAGFFVENFSRQGETFIKTVENTLGVVFAIFFTVAGAKMDLGALKTMWPVAVTMVAVRLVMIFIGARLGARFSGAPPTVQKYVWLGMIPQAGVALGLAVVVEQTFPTWGPKLATIMVAMIGIHESIGPVAFRFALSRAGELNKEKLVEDEELLRDWDKSISPNDAIW